MSGPGEEELRERLGRIQHRIEVLGGRNVTVIAVTKGRDVDLVRRVVAAGALDLGENRMGELVEKASLLKGPPSSDLSGDTSSKASGSRSSSEPFSGDRPRWHLIGRLQRNKVRVGAPFVHLWQSVDRIELGEEISRRAPGASVLVQVNATGEAQKGGCDPSEVELLAESMRRLGLDIRGLMTMGVEGDTTRSDRAFREVRSMADRLGLPECSMGMSDDWETAVAAGATMIRIGRALVASDPPNRPPAVAE